MSPPRWMHFVLVVLSSACCPGSSDTRQPTYATPEPAPGQPPAPTATAPYAAQPTPAPPAATTAPLAPTTAPPAAPAPAPAVVPPPGKQPEPEVKGPIPTPNPKGKNDGEACSASKECKSGTCEGQGCGFNAGKCAPANRMCTRDLVMYCGCNGQTFGASGSCPGRTYRAKGECKAQ